MHGEGDVVVTLTECNGFAEFRAGGGAVAALELQFAELEVSPAVHPPPAFHRQGPAQIALRVVAATGRPRCKIGSTARLRLSTGAGGTRRLVLTMPPGCGGTIAPKVSLAVSSS